MSNTNNKNCNIESSSYLYSQLKNTSVHLTSNEFTSEKKIDAKELIQGKQNSKYASKLFVLVSVALLGVRLGISAIFWDRSVHNYQDMLDNMPISLAHQVLTNSFYIRFLLNVYPGSNPANPKQIFITTPVLEAFCIKLTPFYLTCVPSCKIVTISIGTRDSMWL